MDTEQSKRQLRDAGVAFWRTAVLAMGIVLALTLYGGMAFLVYKGRMGDGPLILLTGILFGYLLRSVRKLI